MAFEFADQNFPFAQQNFPFADTLGTCTVILEVMDISGSPKVGAKFILCLESTPVVSPDGKLVDPGTIEGVTDENGKVIFNLNQGYKFRIFATIFQNKSFVFDTTDKSNLSAVDIFV